ncbi:MAG: 50S ribosomal protein L11 methyltransferase [Verrucomicrobiota bacterium]|nr:50S ribosomal protein L11 methyltransferase [Verrucomicrobiota bacterium]
MSKKTPVYVWRKRVGRAWLEAREAQLHAETGGGFVVVERPKHTRLQMEASCTQRTAARLRKLFGGQVERLPADWLERFAQAARSKPLRIGRRLVIQDAATRGSSQILVIPAGAAFGTGEHATTAMSLRMLERVSRGFPDGWRMLDAGTGSGILALAARHFGASAVIGIDHDPTAISTAKQNASANQIHGVQFLVGDVRRAVSGKFEIIAANLYSELLAEMLPRFRKGLSTEGRLILSGVLRAQEPGLRRALRSNHFRVAEIRRRGKWIALSATHRKTIDAKGA